MKKKLLKTFIFMCIYIYVYLKHSHHFSLVLKKSSRFHQQKRLARLVPFNSLKKHLGKDSNAAIHGAPASCPRFGQGRDTTPQHALTSWMDNDKTPLLVVFSGT